LPFLRQSFIDLSEFPIFTLRRLTKPFVKLFPRLCLSCSGGLVIPRPGEDHPVDFQKALNLIPPDVSRLLIGRQDARARERVINLLRQSFPFFPDGFF
jgi:hypothetical protein